MKKVLLFMLFILVLITTACSLNDGKPNDAIETLFERYRNKDDSVVEQLKEVIMVESLTDNQKIKYQDLMERQYNSLGYVIKDVKEDYETAVATVEITVLNYKEALANSEEELKNNPEKFNDENGNFSEEKYMNYKIDLMEKTDDTISYTLELNLHKENGMWVVEELSNNDISKIHGLY